MDITEENTKQGSVPLNSRVDHHWVEKLFPPHFTLENLLENQINSSEKHFTCMEEPQRGHRRQIYLTALKEVQHIEKLQKKKALTNRIFRQELSVDRMCEEATHENLTDQRVGEKDTSILNEKDISKLRAGFAEMTQDRCQLIHRLNSAEEQLKAEHEEKRMLQVLVEKLEERLSLSSKKAARQSLVINDLKTEGQKMNKQLHELAIQVREKEEQVHGCKTNLRKAKEDLRKTEQERINLARELDGVQAQKRTERDKLEKVSEIENEAALLKLQRELERVKTELCAERDSHARSHAALDLLRKHFSSQ
ncbi:coiled-coil domain-containing protein 160 homolog [Triplophysa dalaica]|uniref:coiled-coil domain-containing protein 160 homolog n=1 Tax=Triplophysa dalaica TaxID=1582913 RepID=UPI0024DF5BDA|nr:coiled-coil domain-containing protein 160 homolog [Triplophysa dalaica]XP_056625512.1 coiled-coil domain-containing protein 160 homolog [Triplophysa dalaica]